jgi:hypothetical protein
MPDLRVTKILAAANFGRLILCLVHNLDLIHLIHGWNLSDHNIEA